MVPVGAEDLGAEYATVNYAFSRVRVVDRPPKPARIGFTSSWRKRT